MPTTRDRQKPWDGWQDHGIKGSNTSQKERNFSRYARCKPAGYEQNTECTHLLESKKYIGSDKPKFGTQKIRLGGSTKHRWKTVFIMSTLSNIFQVEPQLVTAPLQKPCVFEQLDKTSITRRKQLTICWKVHITALGVNDRQEIPVTHTCSRWKSII